MKICIAQINYSSENIHLHYERLAGIIEARRSSDLIVFPELILHGHPSFERPEGFLYRKMKVVYGAVSNDLYRFVERMKARVIIGELKRRGDDYYNVATYIDGGRVESYVKTHVHWTENFVRGKRLKVFDSPFGGIGVNICFDAAFSEVWRVLALKGALIVVNIAAVPKTFAVENMWRRFVGAAVFNQIFVVYANRPGRYFGGHSAVFGPRGEILAKAGAEEEVLEIEIDPGNADIWRREEDLYSNRRPLLYRDIINRHKEILPSVAA